jgi:hypothetical protein
MAMLAEPKRKKKWSLNPRGKQWSNGKFFIIFLLLSGIVLELLLEIYEDC